MNTDFGELLREGVDRLTEGASLPAGVADRARQRHQRRKVRVRATLAGGTAVTAAAAVLLAVSLGSGDLRPGPQGSTARATAYVLSRTERVLELAAQGQVIEEMQMAGQGSRLTLRVRGPSARPAAAPLAAARARILSYQGMAWAEGLTAAGKPLFETALARLASPGSIIAEAVDYPARTWWRTTTHTVSSAALPTCQQSYLTPLQPAGSASWLAAVRRALSCGLYKVAGRERADGVQAIKLVSTSRIPHLAGTVWAHQQTLWVDASTYLPVRVMWAWPAANGKPAGSLTGDIRWLKPTAANRAALRLAVPPGFHRMPAAGFPEASWTFPN